MADKPKAWTVRNRITGKVRTYQTQRAAMNAADRSDNAYGSYICTVSAVWA